MISREVIIMHIYCRWVDNIKTSLTRTEKKKRTGFSMLSNGRLM